MSDRVRPIGQARSPLWTVSGFRRFALALGLAGLLSVLLLAANPLTAAAAPPVPLECSGGGGWQLEHQSTASQSFYDVFLSKTNYFNVRINTNVCHDSPHSTTWRYYSSQFWLSFTSYVSSQQVDLRVWVCGTYYGTYQTTTTQYVESAAYQYNNCARQADNLTTKAYFPYNGAWVTKYITQG